MSALTDMTTSATCAHLQQFICALQWMRTALPNFAKLISLLKEFMENVYERAGKRTKPAVARSTDKVRLGNESNCVFGGLKARPRAPDNTIALRLNQQS